MTIDTLATRPKPGRTGKMKAAIFVEKNRIVLDDKPIRAAPCPRGKQRMRRRIDTVATGRVDLGGRPPHRHTFDRIAEAHDFFANRRDGDLEVAIGI